MLNVWLCHFIYGTKYNFYLFFPKLEETVFCQMANSYFETKSKPTGSKVTRILVDSSKDWAYTFEEELTQFLCSLITKPRWMDVKFFDLERLYLICVEGVINNVDLLNLKWKKFHCRWVKHKTGGIRIFSFVWGRGCFIEFNFSFITTHKFWKR